MHQLFCEIPHMSGSKFRYITFTFSASTLPKSCCIHVALMCLSPTTNLCLGGLCVVCCVLWDWGCSNMGKYALSLEMCSWDTRCPRLILTHGLWADTSFSFSINCLHVADNISKASCFDL